MDHEAAKAEGLPDAPPAAVAAYFASHAAALDAIEKSLLAGPAPDWAVDLAKLHAAPVPNVLGHMQLARVLVGRAEARAAAKDKRADESLRAAFALTGALRGRPEVASQVVSIAATRLELGAVRRIPVDAAAWRERLKTLDPRGGLLMALRHEAWVEYEAAKGLLQGEAPRRPALRASRRARSAPGASGSRPPLTSTRGGPRSTPPRRARSRTPTPRFLGETFQQALARGGVRKTLAIPNLDRVLAPREHRGPRDPEDGRDPGRAGDEALNRAWHAGAAH